MTITEAQIEAGLEAWDLWRAATPSERMRAALEAAERAAWRPIEEAPRDGSPVMLWLRAPFSRWMFARWYEPWGVWLDAYANSPEPGDEMYGCGAEVPTHFRPLPTPGEQG